MGGFGRPPGHLSGAFLYPVSTVCHLHHPNTPQPNVGRWQHMAPAQPGTHAAHISSTPEETPPRLNLTKSRICYANDCMQFNYVSGLIHRESSAEDKTTQKSSRDNTFTFSKLAAAFIRKRSAAANNLSAQSKLQKTKLSKIY